MVVGCTQQQQRDHERTVIVAIVVHLCNNTGGAISLAYYGKDILFYPITTRSASSFRRPFGRREAGATLLLLLLLPLKPTKDTPSFGANGDRKRRTAHTTGLKWNSYFNAQSPCHLYVFHNEEPKKKKKWGNTPMVIFETKFPVRKL